MYAPLNTDGPAIPTLDQIRTGQHTVDVKMPRAPTSAPAPVLAPAPAPASKSAPVVVESVAVVTVTETTPRSSDRWVVNSCCCGCSLATGVWLIAFLEACSWSMGIVAGVFAIVLETQKKHIDSAIENTDAEEEAKATAAAPTVDGAEPPTDAGAEDGLTTEEKVSQLNAAIDAFAIASPFILVMALVGLYFAFKGFKASRGDAAAARSYFWWRKMSVVYAAVALVFGTNGGPVGGLASLLVAVYYAMVVRSHALALEQAAGAEDSTATLVLRGEPV